MRLVVTIDGQPHRIDSNNPALLAAWLTELFTGWDPDPATYIEVQATPAVVPGRQLDWRLDWIADSRIIGQARQARSSREIAAELMVMVEQAETLRAHT